MLAHTSAEVLGLSLEDRVYRVLADARDSEAWSSYNWLLGHGQHAGYGNNSPALRVLAEAWRRGQAA